MGLPGENRDMMLQTIDAVNSLPVETLKIHQLQIIRGTRLAAQVASDELQVENFTADSYSDLCCEIVARLRPDISIERFVSQAPPDMVVSPRWGLKNYQFTDLLVRKLRQRASREVQP